MQELYPDPTIFWFNFIRRAFGLVLFGSAAISLAAIFGSEETEEYALFAGIFAYSAFHGVALFQTTLMSHMFWPVCLIALGLLHLVFGAGSFFLPAAKSLTTILLWVGGLSVSLGAWAIWKRAPKEAEPDIDVEEFS